MAGQPIYIPLSPLIEDLQRYDFSVTIETYLTLNKLLERTADEDFEKNIYRFKTQLCPIFAKTAQQQELFYKLFDKHFAAYLPFTEKEETGEEKQEETGNSESPGITTRRPRVYNFLWIAVVLCSALLRVMVYYFKYHPLEEDFDTHTSVIHPYVPYEPRDTHTYPPDQKKVGPPVKPYVDPDKEKISFASMFVPSVEHFEVKNILLFRISQYGTQVMLGIGLVLTVCYFMYELYLYRNRQFALSKRKGKKPQYSWKLDMGDLPGITFSPEFFKLASLMRKRIVVSGDKPDMQRTALATARNGGMLELVMTTQSRPAEYLVLIDNKSENDLQCFYTDLLLDKLIANGIHITRYYYKDDIRKCRDELFKKEVNLSTLAYHYGDHRLLIIGHAHSFFNAGTSKLFDFTDIFQNWSDRALLTWKEEKDWLDAEFAASSLFVFSGFNETGLSNAIEAFENRRMFDAKQLKEDALLKTHKEISSPLYYEERIKEVLLDGEGGSHDLLHWFGACCLYPELNAELILYIGYVLEQHGSRVYTMENLQKICSLEVFKEGKIPGALRASIITDEEFLPKEKRELVTRAIMKLLEQNAPKDRNTFAYDRWRMNLVLMELMLDPKEKQKKKLLGELKELQQTSGSDEYMVVDYLNKNSGFLNFIVPAKARNIFFRGGEPYQGLHPLFRAFIFLAVISVIFGLLDFNVKKASEETMDMKVYYMDDLQKFSCWNTFKTAYFYNPDHPGGLPYVYSGTKEYQQAMDYMGKAAGADSTLPEFRVNRMVLNYNYAVGEYKKGNFMLANALMEDCRDVFEKIKADVKMSVNEFNPNSKQVAGFIDTFKNEFNYTLGLSYYHLGDKEKAMACNALVDYNALDKTGLRDLLKEKGH